MPLYFGSLFWTNSLPEPARYPELGERRRARAVIIGGGVSGVLCGYLLARSGIETDLIEQRRIASGSTAANAGLLQFANDEMLSELAVKLGEEDAVRFYRACRHAAERVNDIAERLPRNVGFRRRSSLYYASDSGDAAPLRREYEMLARHGFDADWWEADRIANNFPFRRSAAIVTRGDAEVNPYLFVHALAEQAVRSGLHVYEQTKMLSVEPVGRRYIVQTDRGAIEAEHVVYAVGYAPEAAGGRGAKALLHRSYAIVTDPLPSLADWHERFLLWETARPYLYLRTTEDNRVIVGGLDENVRQPLLSKQELRARSMKLLSGLRGLFPGYSPEIRYEWNATFGESPDGLPWLGEDPDRPGLHYCLGYGGNGTIYSYLGAEMIRDRILGVPNPVARIVRPNR
ncbi:NAD(P)/FAD-dependent oxidoreductase [Cohnella hongkongensis]|uniref:NAD(P)/FAD-dependent oxidoreductase n=1 Tax=Cohnella hongkongensis TaxID=178337 RepID=A0ABV9FHJ0_9BACL